MQISQRIIDYAIWYYLRYYPSRKKLAYKLNEKFGPNSEKGKKYSGITPDEIDYIISDKLCNIINEEEVLRAKIKNLQLKGKNVNYIKNNLLQKSFDKDDIDKILEKEFTISENTILSEDILYKKMKHYKNKGKSKNYIRYKFIERNEDKELVDKVLEKIYSGEDELNNLTQEYEKIKSIYDKQKIIEKLLRKGFQYDDIKKIINN